MSQEQNETPRGPGRPRKQAPEAVEPALQQASAPLRRDPELRPVRGVPNAQHGNFLINKDPRFAYAICNPLDKQTGLDYYLMLGWDIVKWTDEPDAVRVRIGRTGKLGDAMTFFDQVVVCILKEHQEAIIQDGVPGLFRGRTAFEAMDARLRGKRGSGVLDPENGAVAHSRHESIEVDMEAN